MADIRTIDWEGIEREYRAGIRTLRDIAAQFGCTHGAINKRAKRDGWTRDLSEKIRLQAEALVSRDAVSTEVSKESKAAEYEIVQANAEMQASIIRSQRTSIGRAREITEKHFAELESVEGLELKEKAQIGKLLSESLKIQVGLERQAFGLADNAEGDKPPSKDVLDDDERRRLDYLIEQRRRTTATAGG